MLRQYPKAVHPLRAGEVWIRDVEMEVVFGTPSKNCSGAGICLITNRIRQGYEIPCPHTPARIHYLPNQELVFRFRKRYLSEATVQAYFRSGFFLVEESFCLPRLLVRRWNLPLDQIQAGRYPVEEFALEWRLYFPIPALIESK
ncbi:MAG: hypothetical protein IPH12_00930 [Saprospirales bacterium]|nr:hypothetical protein [Saprospirales bacterium]MBK8923833.1 hypothetical protein [Saprospirales bacterium]